MYGPNDLPVALLTARSYKREVVSTAPVSGVVIQLTDAGDLTFDEAIDRYWQLLNAHSSLETIALIAAVNNHLLYRQHDWRIQEALTTRCLRPEYARYLQQPIDGGPHPTFRVAFTRLGGLLTLKLLIALMPGDSGMSVQDFPDAYLAGDLAILSNEFTGSSKIREGQKPSTVELLLEFVPRWEIDNPPDLAYSWSRSVSFLQHLRGNDALVRKLRDSLPLDIDTLRFFGLTLGEFVAASFAVFTHIANVSTGDPGTAIIDPDDISENLRFSADLVRRFLAGAAASPEEVKDKLLATPLTRAAFDELLRSDSFTTDTVVLRQNPLLKLAGNRFLVLDRQFLTEQVSSGVYWQIFNMLSGSQRGLLRVLWGRLFELYVFELLGHFYPPMSQILRVEVDYEEGQIDALLDLNEVVIVFEAKASLLLRDARFSRDPAVFENDIRRKFVESPGHRPKALRQLANAACAIAHGTLITASSPQPPRRIFPILLADEASLQSLGINQYLNELFLPLVASHERTIAPLTVMTIEELEELLAYVSSNALSWATFLEERFAGRSVALESVHQAIFANGRFNKAPHLRNEYVLATFKRIWEQMVSAHRTPEANSD